MKKKVIRLTEGDLHRIIRNSVKRILKESVMTIESFKNSLFQNFYDTLVEEFTSVVEKYEYDMSECESYVEMYAHEFATDFTDEAIKILTSKDWDYPKHNFRPLGYVMEKKYKISNINDLLARPDAVEIFTSWFWDAFGTYDVKYNFSTALSELMYDEDEEEY